MSYSKDLPIENEEDATKQTKINRLKPNNQWRSLPSKKPLVIVYENNIPENTFLSKRWWMSEYMHVHKRNEQKHNKTDNKRKSNFTFPKFNSIAPEKNNGWKTILPIRSLLFKGRTVKLREVYPTHTILGTGIFTYYSIGWPGTCGLISNL